MPKVTVVFSDTQKEDREGNRVVDIDSYSVPEFPKDGEHLFSPAQKAAIKFLSRGGQPEVVELLERLKGELKEIANRDANLRFEEAPLPLDVEMNRLQTLDVISMIDNALNSFK